MGAIRTLWQGKRTWAVLGLAAAALLLGAEVLMLRGETGRKKALTGARAPSPSARPDAVLAMALGSPEAAANNLAVGDAAAGRYAEAIAGFEVAISRNPGYLPAYKNLLAACVETGRWARALEAGVKAEELHPLSGEIRQDLPPPDEGRRNEMEKERDFIANLGRAYLENRRLAEAEQRYTLYSRLFPHDLRGMNGLGEVAFRKEEYGRALELFARSLMLYGDQPEVAARLEELGGKAPELRLKARAVLANYLEPKDRGPDARSAGAGPPLPRADPTVRIPEPAVRRPRAPVPIVPARF